MFQTEVYRIMSRKMTVTAMLGVLLLVLYYGVGITVWGEGVIDGGKVYAREEAIAMDKEIAAEFTGPLTDDIIRKDGFPSWCSRLRCSVSPPEASSLLGR